MLPAEVTKLPSGEFTKVRQDFWFIRQERAPKKLFVSMYLHGEFT